MQAELRELNGKMKAKERPKRHSVKPFSIKPLKEEDSTKVLSSPVKPAPKRKGTMFPSFSELDWPLKEQNKTNPVK